MLATIDPIALRLGPISIHWYAICIVSGLLLAVYLAQRWAPEKGIDPENILDFILLAFPIAIVGARLYYVIFQWSYYSQNPSEIVAIWNGGIAIYGGLIAGAAVPLLVFETSCHCCLGFSRYRGTWRYDCSEYRSLGKLC